MRSAGCLGSPWCHAAWVMQVAINQTDVSRAKEAAITRTVDILTGVACSQARVRLPRLQGCLACQRAGYKHAGLGFPRSSPPLSPPLLRAPARAPAVRTAGGVSSERHQRCPRHLPHCIDQAVCAPRLRVGYGGRWSAHRPRGQHACVAAGCVVGRTCMPAPMGAWGP